MNPSGVRNFQKERIFQKGYLESKLQSKVAKEID